MTKEELKKEAEQWAKDHHYYNGTVKGYVTERDDVINAYLAGAEPREKQIQINAENIIALQKQNGELTDRVKELEETINKLREQFTLRYGMEDKIKNLEAQLEREKNLNQCLSDNNEQLREQREKMKCCSNCKFGYKCSLFSTQIHKENGVEYRTQAKWNKEKEKYCNVGYSGKYECWEIKE